MSSLKSVVGTFTNYTKNDLCEDSSINHIEFFESFIKKDFLGTKANVLFVYHGIFNKKNVSHLLNFIASLEQDLIFFQDKSLLSCKSISVNLNENVSLLFNLNKPLSNKNIGDFVDLRKKLRHTKLIYSKITKKLTLCSLTHKNITQSFNESNKVNGAIF